jgi:hypothetical protein
LLVGKKRDIVVICGMTMSIKTNYSHCVIPSHCRNIVRIIVDLIITMTHVPLVCLLSSFISTINTEELE